MNDPTATGTGRAPRRIYMVGNAHIDPVWLWQWQEGMQEVRATFASALARLSEYEDFVFTCDSVAYLAWIEQVDPVMFTEIRRRVDEGRFVVVGGWWIEPDCNLPHGESFVRQALYAQHFLKHHFGRIATVGCNVDPFGHAATLPQLLAKSGMDAYVFLRPEPKEKALPAQLFRWRSPDGSSVLAYRIPYGYTSSGEPVDHFLDRAIERSDAAVEEVMVFYGVGNHGGGPTRANIESIERLAGEDNGLELVMASPRDYFDAVAQRPGVPELTGDLQHHAVGCYSAHSAIKRWNRRAEHRLMAAERLAVLAEVCCGVPYPLERLSEAWKLVCFNQFHDTLAGTAIAPAYEDARDQYGLANQIAAEVTNLSVQAIGREVEVPYVEHEATVLVFNPLAFHVEADVEFELEAPSMAELEAVADDDATPAGLQAIRSTATLGGRHRRFALATSLPPLGYRLYRIRPLASPEEHPPSPLAPPGARASAPVLLHNDVLSARIDPQTGWLTSLISCQDGAELCPREPGAHAIVLEDRSDTWGHDVVAYDEEIGQFSCVAVRELEDGPVRKVIEVESRFANSVLIERFVLSRRARFLEVRATLFWHEQQRALKLRVPTALSAARATFSVPYGRLERPTNGTEEAAQSWVDLAGTLPGGASAGLACCNDGKYAYDARDATLSMTVARSPVYAWHHPHELEEGVRYDHLDQGRQDFSYRLVPHCGDLVAGGVVRVAGELNEPPIVTPEHAHPGRLARANSYADAGEGAVLLSVLKAAEDGGGYIVRAYETANEPCEAVLHLAVLGRRITARFSPGEVKTFFVPRDPGAPAEEVSLLEWSFDALSSLTSARG